AQRQYFVKNDSVWKAIVNTQFRERTNRSTKIASTSTPVEKFVTGGDVVSWRDLRFKVINTTGLTRGAVSYITEIEGKKIAFTGDLILGDGKLFDLYSFQDSLSGGIDGNHGYAARLGQTIKSLEAVAAEEPDVIVPSRGNIIEDPAAAISALIERIRALYLNYLSITAQRWNHTDRMITLSNHVLGTPNVVDWMPFSSVIQQPPTWYKHLNCSNLVISEEGAAFMIDCGTKSDLEAVRKLKKSGIIKSLDGIFISHYHFDHTDFINDAMKEFNCPVYITKELKGILENPGGYHMPSMTPDPITGLTVVQEGQKMTWKEFQLTFYFFPGQTLYHDGLLMEKRTGESVFFTGDSFTPAGIDDYCFQNRNQLNENSGYLYCLNLLKKLPANVLLSNQHIAPVFRFSPQQLDYMRGVLVERNKLINDLLPWDNANFGTDDQWAWIYPYSQKAKAGETVECTVRIWNYGDTEKTFTLRPNLPTGFKAGKTGSIVIPARTEGQYRFKVSVPKKTTTGVALVSVDVSFDNWELREWTEAIIEITR
ncbi:MAG TPA: MBL fold metallo-hydrolase, partial [Chryseolinea sp.]|nr:MBL fold metallo-hydrolase [Chryseolinea sp.]